ncbi:MAG: lipase [Verrucomicrobia bacterium]|jgi:triacylglycerol lipase|nr:lipase [Verrucomicrobiota bacterium]|tara:strand:+ start:46814 stop:47482 length:669 start_codon:yes stop_codon:yes gene_type:complete
MITARFFQLFTGIFATAVSCHPQPQQPRHEKVVMVHGIFEDGKAFDSLKRRLETHGIQCFVPKLTPADGRGGLDKLAEGLKDQIDKEFGEDEKFALVAFSMGGLVSRYYLQKLGGAEHCEEFITVSTPHHGTKTAYSYPTKGVFQMRPGSDFLRDLEETEATLGEMPIVSHRTPMDLIILPTSSSVWSRAENHSHNVVLHPLMLHSKPVLDDIERRFTIQSE